MSVEGAGRFDTFPSILKARDVLTPRRRCTEQIPGLRSGEVLLLRLARAGYEVAWASHAMLKMRGGVRSAHHAGASPHTTQGKQAPKCPLNLTIWGSNLFVRDCCLPTLCSDLLVNSVRLLRAHCVQACFSGLAACPS